MSRRSSVRIDTSSIETGSSATTSSGPMTSAPAMTTRCRWPPEQLVRVAEGVLGGRAEAGRLERTEDPCLAFGDAGSSRLTTSGSATKSSIVCFGSSVSYGSWKMIWTRRR